ncbi:hypothetical protein CGC56_08610 [Capnocytophaga canimorsus]|uniref:Uncharacterized protein n=1 Tax=Capnocytophaga canimorsus TaxID=28188 RepID=A0A250G7A2_9FLAO|nr:hypothetical protein CGC56_08610 [Capnocytophaga canimorsus]
MNYVRNLRKSIRFFSLIPYYSNQCAKFKHFLSIKKAPFFIILPKSSTNIKIFVLLYIVFLFSQKLGGI